MLKAITTLFDTIAYLIIFLLGILICVTPWSHVLQSQLDQSMKSSPWIYLIAGFFLCLLALTWLIKLIPLRSQQFYSIRSPSMDVEVDIGIIRSDVEAVFKETILTTFGDVEVQVDKNKFFVKAKVFNAPEIKQKKILTRLEKEIKRTLKKRLNYTKSVKMNVIFSHETPP